MYRRQCLFFSGYFLKYECANEEEKLNKEKEHLARPYAQSLRAKNREMFAIPKHLRILIISEVAGTVSFDNVIEGITFREESDEQTGFKEKVIVVPTPSSEFTEMVPSCASTMRRQMMNPSPVPLSPFVVKLPCCIC